MWVKSEFLQLLLKNKLTDFIASVSEAVRGLFLPPAKLRPQKKLTMFTNRKRVCKYVLSICKSFLQCLEHALNNFTHRGTCAVVM